MWHTETHTRIDKWGRATKEWAQNVESMENARVSQLKRDASTIAQSADTTLVHNLEDAKCMSFRSQECYVYDVPGVLLKMIQDDRIWQSYVQCGMMLWLLLTSFFAFFFLFWYGHYAKCTNQDSNCVYAGTILWHKRWYDTKMIPIWYGMYAMEWMITNVHK